MARLERAEMWHFNEAQAYPPGIFKDLNGLAAGRACFNEAQACPPGIFGRARFHSAEPCLLQ